VLEQWQNEGGKTTCELSAVSMNDEGLNEESSIEVRQDEMSLLPKWLGTETKPMWEVKEKGKFADSKSPKIERYFHSAGFHNGPLCLKTSFWKVSIDSTRLLKGAPMVHKSLRTYRWLPGFWFEQLSGFSRCHLLRLKRNYMKMNGYSGWTVGFMVMMWVKSVTFSSEKPSKLSDVWSASQEEVWAVKRLGVISMEEISLINWAPVRCTASHLRMPCPRGRYTRNPHKDYLVPPSSSTKSTLEAASLTSV